MRSIPGKYVRVKLARGAGVAHRELTEFSSTDESSLSNGIESRLADLCPQKVMLRGG